MWSFPQACHIKNMPKLLSKDSDLQSLLDEIREKIFTTTLSTRQLAMDKTVVYVGEQLLQGVALLLPAFGC